MPAVVGRWVLLAALLQALAGCETGLSSGAVAPLTPQEKLLNSAEPMAAGHTFMAAGDYDYALKAYTRAVAARGLDAEVLSALGSANLKLGRLRQARTLLGMALDRDDKFVPAWNNLGVVLIGLREYREAREAFRVAFALDAGRSEEIRRNLILAERKLSGNGGKSVNENEFRLVRRGNGRYLLLSTTDQ
ncbi:MAG: tetratricopeptide repeat protein [Paracoccaceae bacterium]